MSKTFQIAFLVLFFIMTTKLSSQDHKNWWQHTNIYQIYPRSFMDSNDDGIGDIQGIISKLDYLEELGFETIWISPFFKSPQRDFGYDVSDYLSISKDFGTMEDAEQLIKEIHNRGMYVVFDLVLNHTSDEHPWFKQSVQKESGKGDWYIWHDGNRKRPPNNWKSLPGPNGWHFNKERGQWYWASFLSFQPDLNWRNPEVKKAMFDVVRFWLDKGVDGFRLDIFNTIYEDAELKKNPKKWNPFPTDNNPSVGFQELSNSMNHPDNCLLAEELRELVDEYKNPERFVIGEVFGRHEEIKNYLGKENNGLNLIFLFDLKRFKYDANFFRDKLKLYEAYYPKPYVPVYVYSNHDDRRSISRIKGSLKKAKLLALFQLMARGVSVTYQGEEFGMSDTKIPRRKGKDPIAQMYKLPQFIVNKLPLLINRDECRTPFQWDSTANAGFSKRGVKTWLPLNQNFKRVNAKKALSDSLSLIYVYEKLLKLRKDFDCIKFGDTEVFEDTFPKNILAFKRNYQSQSALVLINFSKKNYRIDIPDGYSKVVFSTETVEIMPGSEILLKGYQGVVLLNRS
jgi:alpha-glucosidase